MAVSQGTRKARTSWSCAENKSRSLCGDSIETVADYQSAVGNVKIKVRPRTMITGSIVSRKL
jgi:hypothetical protein